MKEKSHRLAGMAYGGGYISGSSTDWQKLWQPSFSVRCVFQKYPDIRKLAQGSAYLRENYEN